MLDVVEAIDGDEPAFRCTEIRRRGPAAVPAREYTSCRAASTARSLRADEAWRKELDDTTIAELVLGVMQEAHRPPCEGRPLARRGRSAASAPATDNAVLAVRLSDRRAGVCRGWPCCGGP